MSTKITVKDNGALRIEGDFEITDAQGRKYDLAGRSVISLCRCGQSANKPFCDGAHSRCSFSSVVEACALPAPKN